ncbi:hypothetical protein [Vibrio sp. 10N.239.312.D08]|uniref:hypothetical protein n=1 Tax=Vibrio sp. 10N.239.312.D08 TaxID=3229978 RepID=UPI00354EF9F3
MNFEKLDKSIEQLKEMTTLVNKVHKVKGHNLANRAIGDLERIVNSNWLNLYEYLAEHGIDPDKHFSSEKLKQKNSDLQKT